MVAKWRDEPPVIWTRQSRTGWRARLEFGRYAEADCSEQTCYNQPVAIHLPAQPSYEGLDMVPGPLIFRHRPSRFGLLILALVFGFPSADRVMAGASEAIATHDHWKTIAPPPFDAILAASRLARFSSEDLVPKESADVMSYFEIQPTERDLTKDGIYLLAKLVIHRDGTWAKESRKPLPMGEYIHWIARRNGDWVGGFSRLDGSVAVTFPVQFMTTDEQGSAGIVRVLAHSPEDAMLLKRYREEGMKASLPGTPPIPPGGIHRPPPPAPPPDGRREAKPPEPPVRCHATYRREKIPGTDPPQFVLIPTGWVVN